MPLTIALAAEASFVARSVDTHTEHLQGTLERAGRHKGSSFVEVLQNCNIFNDGAWRDFTDRDVREDRMLVLEHGKPMIFGKDRDKGIRLRGLHPEVVTIGQDGVTEADLLVHDEHAEDPYLALMLSRMFWPDFPVPVGVLRAIDATDPRPADRGPARGGGREVRARATWTRSCAVGRPGRSSSGGPSADTRRRKISAAPVPGLRVREPDRRGRLRQLRCRPRRPRRPAAGADLPGSPAGRAPRRAWRSGAADRRPDTPLDVGDRPDARAESDCVLVMAGDRLVGIFTDRDAVVKVAGKPPRRAPGARFHDARSRRPPPR